MKLFYLDHGFILAAKNFCLVFKDSLCFPQRAPSCNPGARRVLYPSRTGNIFQTWRYRKYPGSIYRNVFPGRVTGSPAEMLSADYIRQQFQQMGYSSDIRTFNSRYVYTAKNNRKNWHNVTGSTVIAAHEGKAPQQIIIMAHLDTYAAQSDADSDANLGGLTLQGIDDNAAGLGVMLELAEKLKDVPTQYGIRFIATSGEEEGKLGAENILKRMSAAEKKNTLLVINLDNLIVGDKLYFNSGKKTRKRCEN